jgi:hypothetical protein
MLLLGDGAAQLQALREQVGSGALDEAWRTARTWQARCGRMDLWVVFDALDALATACYQGDTPGGVLDELERVWQAVECGTLLAVRAMVGQDLSFPDRFVAELPGEYAWRTTSQVFPAWRPVADA